MNYYTAGQVSKKFFQFLYYIIIQYHKIKINESCNLSDFILPMGNKRYRRLYRNGHRRTFRNLRKRHKVKYSHTLQHATTQTRDPLVSSTATPIELHTPTNHPQSLKLILKPPRLVQRKITLVTPSRRILIKLHLLTVAIPNHQIVAQLLQLMTYHLHLLTATTQQKTRM